MITLMKWINEHTINIIIGVIVAALGYFAPITGVIGVVTASIIIDLIVGILAARKRKQPIESNKLWRTIKKLFYAVLLVTLLFAVDTELGIIQLHKISAWFITGFEIWSILESVAFLVDHPVFYALRDLMEDKIEKKTGIDINKDN